MFQIILSSSSLHSYSDCVRLCCTVAGKDSVGGGGGGAGCKPCPL